MMIAAAWVEGNLEQVKAKQKKLVHSFAFTCSKNPKTIARLKERNILKFEI